MKVTIDFETYSSVDITEQGRHNHVTAPDSDILMMSYKVDTAQTKLWLPGEHLPSFMAEDFTLNAFNAQFEHLVWNTIGVKYGFPPTPINKFNDIMALCGRYGLPQSLGDACAVLNLPAQKDTDGKRLIKLFCSGKKGSGWKYDIEWEKFKQYCMQDTEATYQLMKALPADSLSEKEYGVWLLSCKTNSIGIPVDIQEAEQIIKVVDSYTAGQFELLPELTGGVVTKITQVARLKTWLNSRGVLVNDCTAKTIEAIVTNKALPIDVRTVAEMRASMGLSSIGKYRRIRNLSHKGRVRDNQRYYGAHTGRFTGMGFQLLNLPRAAVADPEAEIAKFFNGRIFEEAPVLIARSLVRSMIKAPSGKCIGAADYASIEYVVLEWLSGNYTALKRYSEGLDPYIDQASELFKVPYDKVSKDQRQFGKIIVLGCGYGLGKKGLIMNAEKQWNLTITEEESELMVKSYRLLHKPVQQTWYNLLKCAVTAVQCPGKAFSTNKCTFKCIHDRNRRLWLTLLLPSGRTMYYAEPQVVPGTYDLSIIHKGINPETKQYSHLELIPGRLTENIVQALARDILIHGLEALNREGFTIIGSIYDEVIVEVDYDVNGRYIINDEGEAKAPFEFEPNCKQLNRFTDLMCEKEEWSKDIPLSAVGFFGPRYRKM